MCGIFAAISDDVPLSADAIGRATEALAHRGPDGSRTWMAPDHRVALGHTRLAVIDLDGGAQPLHDEAGSVHAVVNGEFYDYERIRDELEAAGHRFRTRSDSEILIHLWQEHGPGCLAWLRGEFAFVLWDEASSTLVAARDRFGVKPLYYAASRGALLLRIRGEGAVRRWRAGALGPRVVLRDVPPVPRAAPHACTREWRRWRRGTTCSPRGRVCGRSPTGIWTTRAPAWHLRTNADRARVATAARARGSGRSAAEGRCARGVLFEWRARLVGRAGARRAPRLDTDRCLHGRIRHGVARRVDRRGGDPRVRRSAAPSRGGDRRTSSRPTSPTRCGIARLSTRIPTASQSICSAARSGTRAKGGAHRRGRRRNRRGLRLPRSRHAARGWEGRAPRPRTARAAGPGAADRGGQRRIDSSIRERLGFVPSWVAWFAEAATHARALWSRASPSSCEGRDPYRAFLDGLDFEGQIADREPVHQSLYLWNKSMFVNLLLNQLSDRMEMAHGVEGRLPFLDDRVVEVLRETPVSLKIRGLREARAARGGTPLRHRRGVRRRKQAFLAPPSQARPRGRLHQMLQEPLRSKVLDDVPFFDRAAVVRFLDGLPGLCARNPAALVALTANSCIWRARACCNPGSGWASSTIRPGLSIACRSRSGRPDG